MILGNIVALYGMYLMESFREAYPYLVPLHIGAYTLVLLQEQFDIHRQKVTVST
jgi:hypothetical protein